jgi:tetratricopeptide (TPR) repeat protein
MKLLQDLSFPENRVRIVGLGGGDSLYKQSPDGDEAGKGIFRVPVFIFYKNGIELNRINEFPVLSLEKDMYSILLNQPYLPNYQTFYLLKKWLADSTLLDKNVNVRGLAMQLKGLPASERELNSVGYLFLEQHRSDYALRVFQINAVLFPESANVLSSLGEAYFRNGDAINAALYLERSLELNKDPLLVKEILKILYEVKGVKAVSK